MKPWESPVAATEVGIWGKNDGSEGWRGRVTGIN